MPRKQLLPETQFTLLFQTVDSAYTMPLQHVLPPDTRWRIYRGEKGIYLQQYLARRKQIGLPEYLLSHLHDPHIGILKSVSLLARVNHCIVRLDNPSTPLAFTPDGITYALLSGARDFIAPGTYRFRCGQRMEFTFSFQPKDS